jgi:hypothetical protein
VSAQIVGRDQLVAFSVVGNLRNAPTPLQRVEGISDSPMSSEFDCAL